MSERLAIYATSEPGVVLLEGAPPTQDESVTIHTRQYFLTSPAIILRMQKARRKAQQEQLFAENMVGRRKNRKKPRRIGRQQRRRKNLSVIHPSARRGGGE